MQSLHLLAAALEAHLRPEGAPAYRRLRQGLDALGGLLDALLDLSRLDFDLAAPRPEDFSPCDLLAEVAAGHAAAAEAKGLSVTAEGDSSVVVRTDRTLLRRVLDNLVANAVRYTERGRVVLGCAAADGAALLTVRDTGVGIPPDQIDLVWEEFHQVANPGQDRGRGLGLGLSIVRRLAALLGCRVEIASAVGQGTTFTLSVPLASSPPAPLPSAEATVVERPPASAPRP
jgi:signal transduction histidine kinase